MLWLCLTRTEPGSRIPRYLGIWWHDNSRIIKGNMAAIIPAAAIGAAVGNELPKFFGDALDQFGSGEGIYLRDGEPEGVVAQIGQAVGRAYCRAYNSSNAQYPDGRGERIEAACRPYLNSINATGEPRIGPEFQGGQCSGLTYGTTIIAPRIAGGQATFLGTDMGPIGGVRLIGNGTGGQLIQILSRGRGGGTLCGGVFNITPAPTWRNVANAGSVIYSSVRLEPLQPCGFVDNCGNPAPVTTTPTPSPNPTPPPFRFNPRPEIDVDIDTTINVDGSVTFDIGTGPITIDPFAEPTGGGGEPDGPSGPSDGPPGDVGQPAASDDTDDGGVAAGCAPSGSVLVGVKLTVLDSPPQAREFEPGVFRGAAYIYMGVPGNLDQDFAGAMLRSGQFVFAEKDNLTCYEVRANVGYNIRVTPYYREVES